jgi:hypothetical protein
MRKSCAQSKQHCHTPEMQRYCAATCGTCSHLMVPLQVAWLHGGYLPIPEAANPVLVEIGSSDRNTMDVELLPKLTSAFLVTAEPLLDKYARALGRRRRADKVRDQLEPLGQHHDRGFVLPIAVSTVAGGSQGPKTIAFGTANEGAATPSAGDGMDGELREFHVGPNAGCSSLSLPNRGRHRGRKGRTMAFGSWCDTTGHGVYARGRRVWTVPLRQLLRWIGRPVDFVKIDAQGSDLEIVKSGDGMLHLVRAAHFWTVNI